MKVAPSSHFPPAELYGHEPCNAVGACELCEGAHQAPCALPMGHAEACAHV